MEERERQRAEEALRRKAEEAKAKAEQEKLVSPEKPQDEYSVRAKSSGHGKKTADKWNQ